jgi:hypothetical protein
VYVVVTVGDANGLAMAELLRPVVGDQEYNDAPLAPNWVDEPTQIVLSEPAFTENDTLLIVTDCETVQPVLSVAVTV